MDERCLPGTKCTHSKNGWMNTELFELLFKDLFLKHDVSSMQATPTYPRWAQDTYQSKVCRDYMHIAQPLDTCMFKPRLCTYMLQSKIYLGVATDYKI